MFKGLDDSSYGVGQSANTLSQDCPAFIKNNTNTIENSWGKLMQKSLKFTNLPKISWD